MKFEKFIHKGVNADGTVKSGGGVTTKGGIVILKGTGCGATGCHCSDGFMISVVMPRKKGVVEGIQVTFDSLEEMNQALRGNKGW